MRIDGHTEVIAHLGYPTHAFKAPMIYNPYFESAGINALVVPMGCKAEAFAGVLRNFFRLENARGALVTMPHKVSVVALLDEVSAAVKVAGACNAVKRTQDGRLVGGQFDGTGFVRGLARKGFEVRGARALVVGCGGVGSAIAASLAAAGAACIMLFDVEPSRAEALAERLRAHYPPLHIATGANDPSGFDIVVNATPLGMRDDDPLPLDPERLNPASFVGDVIVGEQPTPLLRSALARGCAVQNGDAMLFEQIPAYLAFFGFGSATAEELRR